MGKDSSRSIDQTSDSLTWSGEQAHQRDEEASQQYEVSQMVIKADVTIQSNRSEEQREASVESSRVSLNVESASISSLMTM